MYLKSDAAAKSRSRAIKLCFVAVWFALVLAGALHHSFWRDEVRALSLALSGSSFVDMFGAIHGEGHPSVWYILLRSAHAVWNSNSVLWVVSLAVALSAMLLLALFAPFGWPLVLLILMTKFALYEYSVMARNYGISMLAMFALAATFRAKRDRGWIPGLLLLALANTNAHSVLLVGAFLLYWAIDVWMKEGLRWTPAMRGLLIGGALAGVGIVLCAATVYPPFNDAAVGYHSAIDIGSLLRAAADPASQMRDLVLHPSGKLGWVPTIILSVLLFTTLLSLLPSVAAMAGGLFAIISFALFFHAIYLGQYRHQALLLVFLMTLYWVVRDARPEPAAVTRSGLLRRIGVGAFVLLIAFQVPRGIKSLMDDLVGNPNSRSAEFATFLSQRPELHDAILMASPDYLLEPMHYYLPNPTYFLREEKFGKIIRFSRQSRAEISLDDILSAAERLGKETGRRVVILIAEDLDGVTSPQTQQEAYSWWLTLSPESVARFRAATTQLTRFGPVTTDETYSVYLLKNQNP